MARFEKNLSSEELKHLKTLAKRLNISVGELTDALSLQLISETRAEPEFRILADRGNANDGLRLLRRLDEAFSATK